MDGRPFPARPVLRAVLWCAACLVAAGCATARGPVQPTPFPGSRPAPGASTSVVPDGLVDRALALRGTRYRLGGENPATGLDCSGLVRHVFGMEGIGVPRTVAEQFRTGRDVRRADARPGDLVFFDTARPGPSHVGILVDATSFVHAPGSGSVVRVDRLDSRYWNDRFRGVKRVSPGATVPTR